MNVTAQYEFAEVLQAGEQFKVSLCFDEYGKQVVSKSLIDTQDEFARSQLDAQIDFLRDSNHTGIVNFHDSTDSELFMEAMGGNLQDLLGKSVKQFSIGEIVSFLRQMLTLLTHLDSRNLTIGQFSPRTVLANDELNIFKIAKAYKKDSPISADANEKIFPPEINSPEEYDVHTSDIYCLGMTCVELAMGQVGFESLFKGMYDNSSDLWIRWHENQYETLPPLDEILEGFPNGLTDILQTMIAKPLQDRYSTSSDVLNDLNKLGIVDADVTVKKSGNLNRRTFLLGCAALALAGVVGWPLLSKNPPPIQTEQVVNSPPKFKVEIESNRDFDYQIVQGDRLISNDRFDAKAPKFPQIEEGCELYITSLEFKNEGWRVILDGREHDLKRSLVRIADGSKDTKVNLVFVRQYKLKSNYKEFVWKFKLSDTANASDIPVQREDDEQDHILIKPNDNRLNLAGSPQDGWFKVDLPSEYDNQINLGFELPVEVEIVGHSSLSSIFSKLQVTVGDHPLDFDGQRFQGDIPMDSSGIDGQEIVVAVDGNKIFDQQWNQAFEIANTNKAVQRVQLKRVVNFELPNGFVLSEVNGESGFQENEQQVEVPFGKKLEFKITDQTGVICIQDSHEWKDHVSVTSSDYLVTRLLLNHGNSAKFFLFRTGNPSQRMLVGVTNRTGSFPVKNQGEYEVAIEMISNSLLKQTIPLAEFLASSSIELQQASVR